MQVLAINGSPHKDGLCKGILTRVLEGVDGADVKLWNFLTKNCNHVGPAWTQNVGVVWSVT